MPIIKSAIKRAKQAIRLRDHNRDIKKDIKEATKSFIAEPTKESLSKAQSELDKAVKKGLIKKNTASRRKSNLSKVAKKAGASTAKPKIAKKKAASKTTKKAAK